MTKHLTVKQFAERTQMSTKTVYARIKDKSLKAIDYSKDDGKRKTWRIPESEAEAFERHRLNSEASDADL